MSHPLLSPAETELARAIRRLEDRLDRAGAGQVFVPVADLEPVLEAARATLPRDWRRAPEAR